MSSCGGHVCLLVDVRPGRVREVAAGLARYLDQAAPVVVTLDEPAGHLALGHVRDADLSELTEWFYRRGARRVFVRYEHEGPWPAAPRANFAPDTAN
jgi:hypothetical protein